MSKAVAVVLALVAGAAGGFLASWIAKPAAPPAADDGATPAAAAATGRVSDAERRLARLESQVAAIRPPRSEAQASAAPGPAAATAASDLTPQVAAMDKRLAALETIFAEGPLGWKVEDLAKLSDDDLMKKARAFSAPQNGNPEAAIRYWEALRQRKTDAATQDEALFAEGTAYNALKQYPQAEAAFRDVMRLAGPETSRGTWAQFQVGWTRAWQNDEAGALENFEKVASTPATEELVVIHSLLRAGVLAQKLGDPARSRTSLDRLMRDYSEKVPASQQWILAEAKKTLAAAEGR